MKKKIRLNENYKRKLYEKIMKQFAPIVAKNISESFLDDDSEFENPDVKMLREGPYPYYLQQRVLSDKGHLSNKQASDYLAKFIGNNTKKIVFAHISEKNNSEEKVLETFEEVMNENNITFKDLILEYLIEEIEKENNAL